MRAHLDRSGHRLRLIYRMAGICRIDPRRRNFSGMSLDRCLPRYPPVTDRFCCNLYPRMKMPRKCDNSANMKSVSWSVIVFHKISNTCTAKGLELDAEIAEVSATAPRPLQPKQNLSAAPAPMNTFSRGDRDLIHLMMATSGSFTFPRASSDPMVARDPDWRARMQAQRQRTDTRCTRTWHLHTCLLPGWRDPAEHKPKARRDRRKLSTVLPLPPPSPRAGGEEETCGKGNA
eukprot:357579-Chlamydomonas_euryale.AAC.4